MTLKEAIDNLVGAVDEYADWLTVNPMPAVVLAEWDEARIDWWEPIVDAACELAPHLRKPQTDQLDGFDMADYLGTRQKATLIEEG